MSRQKEGKRTGSTPAVPPPGGPACPLCAAPGGKPVSGRACRFFRCRRCGIVFNSAYRPLHYDERYFLDDYRNQYGKTYAEDRDAIRRLADARLKKILALHGRKPPHSALGLLDIGSALGFFMESARDAGIGRVRGVEISRYACDWCRRESGLQVANTPFENAEFDETFDIISAWYFIEHCEHPREVIERIYALLNPAGIFAFSAPSVFGPQFLFDRNGWVESHPEDHRIDFSPASAVRILKRMGFRAVMVRAAGMHPDRLVHRASPFYRPFSLLYGRVAPLLRFSDTIEVYARK